MKRISVAVEDEQKEHLEALANAVGCGVSEVVRMMIDHFSEVTPEEAKEDWKKSREAKERYLKKWMKDNERKANER